MSQAQLLQVSRLGFCDKGLRNSSSSAQKSCGGACAHSLPQARWGCSPESCLQVGYWLAHTHTQKEVEHTARVAYDTGSHAYGLMLSRTHVEMFVRGSLKASQDVHFLPRFNSFSVRCPGCYVSSRHPHWEQDKCMAREALGSICCCSRLTYACCCPCGHYLIIWAAQSEERIRMLALASLWRKAVAECSSIAHQHTLSPE